jgi:hypothetical protein
MSSRYASIIIDDDGREVVSAIGQFEGAAPQGRAGHFEPVAAGVRIGMVRGGPVDAVGGFGFPWAGISTGAVSIVRATLKALPDAGPVKRGTTAEAKPDAASRPHKPRSARAKPGKRAKSRKRVVRPGKKTAKPAISAGAAG